MTLDIDAIERLAALPVGRIEDLVNRFNTAEQQAHNDVTDAMIRLQDKTADFYREELTALCAEVRELRAALDASRENAERTWNAKEGLYRELRDMASERDAFRLSVYELREQLRHSVSEDALADAQSELAATRAALERARALVAEWQREGYIELMIEQLAAALGEGGRP